VSGRKKPIRLTTNELEAAAEALAARLAGDWGAEFGGEELADATLGFTREDADSAQAKIDIMLSRRRRAAPATPSPVEGET
jgi:hypothetical protein